MNDQDRARCLAQVERIAESPIFNSSAALSKLLLYLAGHSLQSPSSNPKEYQIAIEVLGRSGDFDPQTDASVRVQIGRLRTRLSEYYGSLGAGDPIVVSLPRGGHSLHFELRDESKELGAEPQAGAEAEPRAAPRQYSVRHLLLAVLATAVLTSGVLLLVFHIRSSRLASEKSGNNAVPPALDAFWSPFLRGADGPFVIFSNADFVGDPLSGMRYFDAVRDKNRQAAPYYTGVGEVMGTVELDKLFHLFGRNFRLKRSGLFTLDDALNNDLIFLGTPVEDVPLGSIPNTREFVLRRLPGDTDRWWNIVDVHPPKGTSGIYRTTLSSSSADSEDYAVVALVPGLGSNHRTLILEGISTLGTQAAVDFVCTPGSVQELLNRLGAQNGAAPPFFEALLKVEVANNVPLHAELLQLRKY